VDKQHEMLIESYFADCNDAAAKLFGAKSRAELIGTKSKSLFGNIPAKSYTEMLKKFIHDGYRSIDARIEVEFPDGSSRVWLHQRQGVVQDGKLLRSWVSARDITALATAEDLAAKQNSYRNSSLTDGEIKEYVADIEKAMKAEQPYLDPSFNLSKLSKLIRVPDYQISQILNMGMKTSFYDLINRYRIEHLVMLLSKPEHDSESILDLAYQVGFNSKSTFNIAFKKITGKTPSTYRTQLQLNRARTL
jgi:AraC-like DNA-binding protein